MVVVGIDACRTGWIAVALREGSPPEAHYLRRVDRLGSAVADVTVVAIDIPIGFATSGFRAADVEAQRFLGRRRAAVFRVPCRAVLEAETHAEATAVSLELCGRGVSQQAYALRTKIFEVEAWVPRAPAAVYEVHPEVSFGVLMGGPVRASKKTWAGMVERREALAAHGIVLDRVGGDAASHAAVDDMLDAAVAAWTAGRILTGHARSFPVTPDTDADGRPVAIWA